MNILKKYGDKTLSNDLFKRFSERAIETNKRLINGYVSKSEKELIQYVKSLGVSCSKDRKTLNGKEIDILIKGKRIGIEYNGNHYHGKFFGGKDKNYHLNKTTDCLDKGVYLIHVFEDEYELSKEQVKEKIRYLIGCKQEIPPIPVNYKKVSKRDGCEFIKEFNFNDKFDGRMIGCYNENKLISIMNYQIKNNILTIKNFTTKNYSLFEKTFLGLLTSLKQNIVIEEIIIEIDRRWFNQKEDKFYKKLGFTIKKYTTPKCFYYNSSINRYKRFKKSETIKGMSYDKIYDCGLVVYSFVNQFLIV